MIRIQKASRCGMYGCKSSAPLRPDLTGTTDAPGTQKQVMKAADFEALGFFEHDGSWYLTGGPTCGNCGPHQLCFRKHTSRRLDE